MSIKLKTLGLGLFAMAAMGAFGVMNAGAAGGGTFDVGDGGETITVSEEPGTSHNLVFELDTGGIFDCTVSEYHGDTADGVVPSITVTPNYQECFTAGNETKFLIDENGCTFEFTVGANPEADNTVHVCESGGPMIINHPNCELTVEEQTVGDGVAWDHDVGSEGVSYTLDEAPNGADAITLDSTAVVEGEHHGGACQILGTEHTLEMRGSATVIAEDGNGFPVDLIATGS